MDFLSSFQAQKKAVLAFMRLTAHVAAVLLFPLNGLAQTDGQVQCLLQPYALPDIPPPGVSLLGQNLFWLLKDKPAARFGVVGLQADPAQMDSLLAELYLDNGFAPYWVTEARLNQKRTDELLAVLNKADEDGLNPARYRPVDIVAVLSSAKKTKELAQLDILLTLSMSAYITDMRKGRAASTRFNPTLLAAVRDNEGAVPQMIEEGLHAADLQHFLEMQAPQHNTYRALKKLLAKYREIEAKGGWPQIPEGKKIEPGMADDRLGLLAQRLLITGDLPAQPLYADTAAKRLRIYDGELVKGVKRFQSRCNIKQDGILGKTTIAALNVPVRDQINKIILNLERWRWLSHLLNGRRLVVNIAGFSLTVMNDEQVELAMPVIVGEEDHKTPVFSHAISYIELNPYWNVPPSIARKEIVAKMQKDPGYLNRQHIRIFAGWGNGAPEISSAVINWHTIGSSITRYRLRQEPGKGNALGTIKFVFPNSSSIYMHDTPSRNLFQQAKRSLSHGCIRVSQPLELAWHLLQHDGYNLSKERLQQEIASQKQQSYILRKPVPVHLLYLTTQITEDGIAHFYEDIYGNDTQLAEALHQEEQIGMCPLNP
jgi:murein L,D-transpeptidase YcbB/YkuD